MGSILSAVRLRELLDYDPVTGLFRNKVNRGTQAKAGEVTGGDDGEGYVRIKIDGRYYRANRLAWLWMTGDWPQGHVDHQNTLKSDNSWDNLRPATQSQNSANRGVNKNNKLGVKGVYWSIKDRAYRAVIRVNYKAHYLGIFATVDEASAAYRAAAKIYFKEFARD